MMIVKTLIVLSAVHFVFAIPSNCRDVKGTISSSSFTENCPSLCTEGQFTGGLNGDFEFVLTGLTDFPNLGAPIPAAGVGALTMTLTNSNLCAKGTVLEFVDASSFVPNDLPDDSYFGGVQTVKANEDCGVIGGFITTSGIFNDGCIDCVYNGVVCFGE